MIAGLFTTSALVSDNIMTPCYYPESATASRILKDILLHQVGNERCSENMLRALMHSAYTTDEMDAASERAVVATLDEAVCKLDPILADSDTFRADLSVLLQKFIDVWKTALLSNKLILATTEHDDISDADVMEEFGSTATPSTIVFGRPKFETLSLFPRIYVPELEYIVHRGIVLSPWQEIVLAAESEYWNCTAQKAKKTKAVHESKDGATRSFSRRERHASLSPSKFCIGRRPFSG